MAGHATHVTITGRVQGVGYRAWVEREAVRRRLSGWVRNRRDGAVEAVFAGSADAVAAMVSACRDGPRAAVVSDVVATPAAVPPGAGFRVLMTE